MLYAFVNLPQDLEAQLDTFVSVPYASGLKAECLNFTSRETRNQLLDQMVQDLYPVYLRKDITIKALEKALNLDLPRPDAVPMDAKTYQALLDLKEPVLGSARSVTPELTSALKKHQVQLLKDPGLRPYFEEKLQAMNLGGLPAPHPGFENVWIIAWGNPQDALYSKRPGKPYLGVTYVQTVNEIQDLLETHAKRIEETKEHLRALNLKNELQRFKGLLGIKGFLNDHELSLTAEEIATCPRRWTTLQTLPQI